jgi:hypothetical protein
VGMRWRQYILVCGSCDDEWFYVEMSYGVWLLPDILISGSGGRHGSMHGLCASNEISTYQSYFVTSVWDR